MVAVLGQALDLDQPVWHGLYPGTVVSTDDPDRGGRVRVRVPQVYGDQTEDEYVPDEQLPWARPCYPSTGSQHGEAWAPEKDAAVFVTFWGGDPERPVIVGGWYPPKASGGTKIPTEFSSSYEGGAPRTRIIKTENGHVFEMRWKAGQEHVYIRTAGGSILDLVDAPALGGPKIVATLPSGRTMGIDDKLQRAFVQTPTQSVIIDDALGAINATSPTQINAVVGPTSVALTPTTATVTAPAVNVTATGVATITATSLSIVTGVGGFTLPFVLTALALTINCLAFILNAAGVLTMTATGVASFFGSAVLLGSVAGTKRRLIDERFFTNPGPQNYPSHTHDGVTPGGGVSGAVSAGTVPVLAAVATADTTAS